MGKDRDKCMGSPFNSTLNSPEKPENRSGCQDVPGEKNGDGLCAAGRCGDADDNRENERGWPDAGDGDEDEGWDGAEGWDEDEILEPREHRPMRFRDYVIITVVILAFSAFGLSSFPYGLSNRYQFLEENRVLQSDQLVEATVPALAYVMVETPSGTHQGTGFNISPRGRILTNLHVVNGGGLIHVEFSGGQKYTVQTYTAVLGADIAWLDLNSQDLPYIGVEQNSLPSIGQKVTIIGNPLGFRFMAQRGLVQNYYQVSTIDYTVFDIDIAANPGNSGSPVMNNQGRACGIVFAITSVDTGSGLESRTLAIPLAGLDLGL